MATYKLAVIIKNPSNDDEFLLVKQTPPPKFGDQEYDSYVDSDLWDLPSTQLNSLQGHSKSQFVVEDQELYAGKLDFSKLDIDLALNQVLEQVGMGEPKPINWKFWKFVDEPDFGPGLPIQTVYIIGKLRPDDGILTDLCKWVCTQSCLKWLLEVKSSSDRIGPLVVLGPLKDSMNSEKCSIPPTSHFQEYPPGIKIVPMGSRTAKPFRTTNLVVFAPEIIHDKCGNDSFVAHGDALIVDPGCRSEFHSEVFQLFRRAILMLLFWLMKIPCVIFEKMVALLVIPQFLELKRFALAGHTDGHMALLHVSTHSLVVGDHCVGQGSAVLDISAGGNMNEYFNTTYKFMELSPHTLIPMHGRVNLWPKHLLCGYLKNRRARESSILKSIEDGAKTLFDIVAHTYSDVDRSLWIPASSNVRLHVDHLAQQDKLPKGFSIENFNCSCDVFAGKVGKM